MYCDAIQNCTYLKYYLDIDHSLMLINYEYYLFRQIKYKSNQQKF